MKFGKLLATGLAAVTLLGTATTTVNAFVQRPELTIIKKTYAYNSKGKRKGKPYYKGWKFALLETRKIKGKKYYRVGKNKYILASKVKKYIPHVYEPDYSKPLQPKWQSKHLVDTNGDIYEQTKKAYELHGDDRLEAFKEIANEKQMLNKTTGEIFGGLEPFESIIKTDYYNHMEAVTGKPFTDDTLH